MNSIVKVPENIAKKYPLEKWDYYMSTKVIKGQVYYDCNYCWSSYTKSGKPYKKAKKGYHFHGIDKSGITARICECIKSNRPVVVFSHPYYLEDDEIKKDDNYIESKLCRKCSTVNPLSDFSRQGEKHRSTCRSCVSKYAKDNYKKNGSKYYTPTGKPRGRPKKT